MQFYLHKDIILTKGLVRSVIQDFTRANYELIPNELLELLRVHEGKISKVELRELVLENFDSDEYYNLLVDNEYIFECSSLFHKHIKDVSTTFEIPFELQSIKIDASSYRTESIMSDHGFGILKLHLMTKIIEYWNVDKSSIQQVLETIDKISKERIIQHVIVTTDKFDLSDEYLDEFNISIRTVKDGSNVYPKLFSNRKLHNESISYNTYTNGRIEIRKDGSLVTSSNDRSIMDFVSSTDLLEYIRKDNYWDIPKSQIEICEDCEFRFMCLTDMNLTQKESKFYYKEKCTYNPSSGEWD